MNVLFVTWDYLPVVGGTEIYLKNLTERLAQKGVNCHIVAGPFKGTKRREKIGNNITIYRTRFLNRYKKKDRPESAWSLSKFLQKLIQKKKIDLISAQDMHKNIVPSLTLAINSASLITNTPQILTLHTHMEDKLSEELLKNMNWDKIIGVSKSVVEEAYRTGVSPKKLIKIYPGIDTNLFKLNLGEEWLRKKFKLDIKDKDIVVFTPCRVIEKTLESKGLRVLLKAMSIVGQFADNVKLVIAAAQVNPNYLKTKQKALTELKNLARVYEIEKKIKIVEEGIRNEDMPLAYNSADIMALPSLKEAFGLVYIEAMACGLPVIGCSIPGVSEIITNGTDGYLIAPDNDVALAKRIAWLIRDKKRKMRELGKRARETVKENFTLKRMVDETLDVYKGVIEKNK